MIPIGQFARLLGISTRTLRHYDAIGLFPPALVQTDNGYRYYRPQQIAELQRILQLRRLGVALETIQALRDAHCLADAPAFATFLRRHRAVLVREIADRSRLLDEIDQTLSSTEKGQAMSLQPTIVELPAFHVTGVGATCEDPSPIPALWTRLLSRRGEIEGQTRHGTTFGVCQRIDPQSVAFHYTAGVATTPDAALPEAMERLLVPAQRYARFTYVGPASGIPEACRRIWAALEPEWGLVPSDGPDLELYDERFMGGDDPRSETDLYIPLQPA